MLTRKNKQEHLLRYQIEGWGRLKVELTQEL